MSPATYSSFAIPETLQFTTGQGDLPKIVINTPLAAAEIHLLGATVTHFQPAGSPAVIWLSPLSPFAEGKGIRGGVPICWPWFGPHKTDKTQPTHGFARTKIWEVRSTACLSDGRVRVVLGLDSSEQSRAVFPYEFSLRAIITVGQTLDVVLLVHNTGKLAFSFENCFHTYLQVGDTGRSSVTGFNDTPCLDRHKGDTHSVQNGPVAFDGEVTKVLLGAMGGSELLDPANKRKIVTSKTNAVQTVVWNPGAANAAKMPEIDSHWNTFVCIEAANCLDQPIHLAPGLSHRSAVSYRSEAL